MNSGFISRGGPGHFDLINFGKASVYWAERNRDDLGVPWSHSNQWFLELLSERRQKLMPKFDVYVCSGVRGTELIGRDDRDRGFHAT